LNLYVLKFYNSTVKPPLPPTAPVSKAVAFEIIFDDTTNKPNIEEILKNKPPRSRFQVRQRFYLK
jgi:hypothetical protein